METPPPPPPAELRQRRGVSFTSVPNPNGAVIVEETPIPPCKNPQSTEASTNNDEEEVNNNDTPISKNVQLSGKAVAKDEHRRRKILVRVMSGALLVSF